VIEMTKRRKNGLCYWEIKRCVIEVMKVGQVGAENTSEQADFCSEGAIW
jgi:hypothetical protein